MCLMEGIVSVPFEWSLCSPLLNRLHGVRVIFTPSCQQFDHRSTAAIQSLLPWLGSPFSEADCARFQNLCYLELSVVKMELLLENCVRDVSEYRTGQCPDRGHSQVVLWAQWCVLHKHWQSSAITTLDEPGKSWSRVADQLSKAAYWTSVFFPDWNSSLL